MSRGGQVALWTFLALVVAVASWTGYGIGQELSRGQAQRLVVVVIGSAGSVTCSPPTACSTVVPPSPEPPAERK